MKRSEMIKKMTQYWLGLNESEINNLGGPDAVYETVRMNMEYLLDQMEHHGMKPPLTTRDPVLFRDEHVWEKED